MPEVAITLPFSVDSYGKIGSTLDQKKIWADRVKSVIGTSLRERVMRPTFGTIIPYALFETSDNAEKEIKNEVEKAFGEQLPLLELREVNISFDSNTNIIDVEIVYALPNDEVQNTIIGLVSIRGNNPIYEELL